MEGYSNMAELLSKTSDYAEISRNLTQFYIKNPQKYLYSLSLELNSDTLNAVARGYAGRLLKDALDAKNAITTWESIEDSVRNEIKELHLNTLHSLNSEAGNAAANVIAFIASIEIPKNQWPDLIATLLQNVTQHDSTESLKKATMESVGYICEVVSPKDVDQTEADSLLRTVYQGLLVSETDLVRRAAATALCKALRIARTHFEKENERKFLMDLICDTAKADDDNIKKAAYECLEVIASLHYDFLEPHIRTLFWVISDVFEGSNYVLLDQAIKFWGSLCDKEIKLQKMCSPHNGLIEKAMPMLVPMLLSTLLDQDNDGIWTPVVAGGTCLGLVARTVGDSILQYVRPFIQNRLSECNGMSRGAGAYALTSILESLSVEKLYPEVYTVLPILLIPMEEKNIGVKRAISWTVRRIFELFRSPNTNFSVISPKNINGTVRVLLESIRDSKDVAENGCWAMFYLANGYKDPESGSSVLTPCLAEIITSLIETAERTDMKVSSLQSIVYNTLKEVVMTSNSSVASQTLRDQLTVVISKLEETLKLQILLPADREKQGHLVALLCAFIQKLSSSEETMQYISQVAKQMMKLFLKVFRSTDSIAHKEAILAIGVLANATGPEFVNLVNCDEIMKLLSHGLASSDYHLPVKPVIVSSICDIARAIGEQFEKYAIDARRDMQVAMKACEEIDVNDKVMSEYRNQLETNIIEADDYISNITAMKK